ncbi:hypothetical protein GE061_018807 [Apolygus lucorum]|uniref:FP protein C-terminal domain-containing protein n=1 Tax=Apolygus lucorum TaxID=248454 RepID=A0A8S9X6N1_APOLU|nr:hypothetical protein GE061_018807 [Apolygus lucorum]
MSNQFDRFVEEMETLRGTVKELSKENEQLKSAVGDLHQKVDFLEQISRNANVEIHGVPETKNENCIEILKEVSRMLEVENGSIPKAFRVGPPRNDRPRKILAVMDSMEARDKLVRAAKGSRELTAKNLHSDWPNERVYVNENLTSYRADLLRRTKIKARERDVKYVWLKNCVIHVRKSDGGPVSTIKSPQDLERM